MVSLTAFSQFFCFDYFPYHWSEILLDSLRFYEILVIFCFPWDSFPTLWVSLGLFKWLDILIVHQGFSNKTLKGDLKNRIQRKLLYFNNMFPIISFWIYQIFGSFSSKQQHSALSIDQLGWPWLISISLIFINFNFTYSYQAD